MSKKRRDGGAPGSGRGSRQLARRVKTARGRSVSSTRWLERQLNDPYVQAAREDGYRSRAAYKLIEIDARYGLLKPGARVLDLGAAPGGWLQVAAERVGPKGALLGVDLQEIEAAPGAEILTLDFLAEDAEARILAALGGEIDVVLSDMAAPATGHKPTDSLRTMALAEAAYDFAAKVLKPGGAFLAKTLQGGTEAELLAALKRDFATVRHVKPPASRAGSSELYVLAQGYRGGGS